MLRLQYVLFQADESARMLRAGSVPHLRTALLLLDNSAEVLLDRWIENRMADDELRRVIRDRAVEAGIPRDHPHFVELFAESFLTSSEVSRVARYFDEKLKFVSEKHGALSSAVASTLSHIHRYRNETYHTGRVRTGILRTTVVIQLHLVCDLVRILKPGSGGYSSGDDFSWLTDRFRTHPTALFDDREMDRVLQDIKSAAELSPEAINAALAMNLDERIAALDDAIAFITTEARTAETATAAIAAAQEFTLRKSSNEVLYPPPPRGIDQPLDGLTIDRVRHIPDVLRTTSDPSVALSSFAVADTSLDRIEFVLNQLAMAIDQQIQFEIDRARGK